VDIDTFWDIIDAARAHSEPSQPLDQALAFGLAARTRQDILDFYKVFDQLRGELYRWDVWAAAYLIGGGCSDDGFIDFRAGIIGLGRDWYQKVAASPDSLAGHPAIAGHPGSSCGEPFFFEGLAYAAAEAFEQISGGEQDFYDALGPDPLPGLRPDQGPAGEDFDFDDDEQMRRRLPRLAAACAEAPPEPHRV
jgi:Protein of unknown function (DUF4240)